MFFNIQFTKPVFSYANIIFKESINVLKFQRLWFLFLEILFGTFSNTPLYLIDSPSCFAFFFHLLNHCNIFFYFVSDNYISYSDLFMDF